MDKQEVRKAMTEAEVIKIIEGRRTGDEVEEIYGPTQVGAVVLWEIWVTDKEDKWAVRYLEEFEDGRYAVFETFQGLTVSLNKRIEGLVERREQTRWRRAKELTEIQNRGTTKLISVVVGSVAFLVVIGVFAYATLKETRDAYLGSVVLASVIASACAFFYGRFVQPKLTPLPNPTEV